MIECYENETQTNLLTVFGGAVELFVVPASRVDASKEFSTGRLQASIDHGALSYILQTSPIPPHTNAHMRGARKQRDRNRTMKKRKYEIYQFNC